MQNVQNALEENLSSGNMFGNCETDAKESEYTFLTILRERVTFKKQI